LPVGTTATSAKYRAANDPTNQTHKKFFLIDTPGHRKLRYHAFEHIRNSQNLRGLIFLVDSANLSIGGEGLRQTSEFLYDTLLLLQERTAGSKTAKEIPVLIAANKMDLFTALPAALVRNALEKEITKIRDSRSKRLLDSGVGMGEGDSVEDDKNDEWLGEVGSTDFRFAQMEELNIPVAVAGGSILSTDIEKWWDWVGERL
jgi:signal recognition particle receptor subunit beta